MRSGATFLLEVFWNGCTFSFIAVIKVICCKIPSPSLWMINWVPSWLRGWFQVHFESDHTTYHDYMQNTNSGSNAAKYFSFKFHDRNIWLLFSRAKIFHDFMCCDCLVTSEKHPLKNATILDCREQRLSECCILLGSWVHKLWFLRIVDGTRVVPRPMNCAVRFSNQTFRRF